MNRSEFIKKSCTVCGLILATGAVATLMTNCASFEVIQVEKNQNQFKLSCDRFLEGEKIKLLKNKDLSFDIIIIKNSAENYQAFLMKCTHLDAALLANNNGITCNLHGSAYNLKGQVVNGPATEPLKEFKTEIIDNSIVITL